MARPTFDSNLTVTRRAQHQSSVATWAHEPVGNKSQLTYFRLQRCCFHAFFMPQRVVDPTTRMRMECSEFTGRRGWFWLKENKRTDPLETFPANFSLAIPTPPFAQMKTYFVCMSSGGSKQGNGRRTAERGGETEREGLNVGEKEGERPPLQF